MKEIEGSCLCGSVRFTVSDDFVYSGYCHCSECRRFSGSSFSIFGGVLKEKLKLIQGETDIGRYRKSEKSIMCFCRNCGSSLFADKPKINMVHLRVGTLSRAPILRPQIHICVASKAEWHDINDDLPQFAELPPSV
jgi:hypothetical protein